MTSAPGQTDALMEVLKAEGLDTVEGAFAYSGGRELRKPGLASRSRMRLTIADTAGRTHKLYLKRYGPQPVVARLRHWLAHGSARSPAAVEFANIRAARQSGVPTMQEVLFGEEPGKLGSQRSYLIVETVPGEALERCFDEFLTRSDARAVDGFTKKLADVVRTFHEAGYAHRDLYASHIFMEVSAGRVNLYLIDLARMFSPRRRRFRWQVKDLAQLKYSMPPSWVADYWDAFMQRYMGRCDERFRQRLGRAIDRKVGWMRLRARRKCLPEETIVSG